MKLALHPGTILLYILCWAKNSADLGSRIAPSLALKCNAAGVCLQPVSSMCPGDPRQIPVPPNLFPSCLLPNPAQNSIDQEPGSWLPRVQVGLGTGPGLPAIQWPPRLFTPPLPLGGVQLTPTGAQSEIRLSDFKNTLKTENYCRAINTVYL